MGEEVYLQQCFQTPSWLLNCGVYVAHHPTPVDSWGESTQHHWTEAAVASCWGPHHSCPQDRHLLLQWLPHHQQQLRWCVDRCQCTPSLCWGKASCSDPEQGRKNWGQSENPVIMAGDPVTCCADKLLRASPYVSQGSWPTNKWNKHTNMVCHHVWQKIPTQPPLFCAQIL